MPSLVTKAPDGRDIVFLDLHQERPVGYLADVWDERYPDPAAIVVTAYRETGRMISWRFLPQSAAIGAIHFGRCDLRGNWELEAVEARFCYRQEGDGYLVAALPAWRDKPLYVLKVARS